jgi:hypothetical protein
MGLVGAVQPPGGGRQGRWVLAKMVVGQVKHQRHLPPISYLGGFKKKVVKFPGGIVRYTQKGQRGFWQKIKELLLAPGLEEGQLGWLGCPSILREGGGEDQHGAPQIAEPGQAVDELAGAAPDRDMLRSYLVVAGQGCMDGRVQGVGIAAGIRLLNGLQGIGVRAQTVGVGREIETGRRAAIGTAVDRF